MSDIVMNRAVAGLAAFVAIACVTPALADQNVLISDNGTVHCVASAKDLTRITLAGDAFASVSKVQSDNPAEDFSVVNEPLRGDLYLSVGAGFSRPALSFFGITRKGYVYRFVCSVIGADAEQVFVANNDLSEDRPIGAHWSSSLDSHAAATRLITAMYEQQPIEGFEMSWRAHSPVTAGLLIVQLVGSYKGAGLIGRIIKLTNSGAAPIALDEADVAPADAIAVSIAEGRLAPGSTTTAFIVMRSEAQP